MSDDLKQCHSETMYRHPETMEKVWKPDPVYKLDDTIEPIKQEDITYISYKAPIIEIKISKSDKRFFHYNLTDSAQESLLHNACYGVYYHDRYRSDYEMKSIEQAVKDKDITNVSIQIGYKQKYYTYLIKEMHYDELGYFTIRIEVINELESLDFLKQFFSNNLYFIPVYFDKKDSSNEKLLLRFDAIKGEKLI